MRNEPALPSSSIASDETLDAAWPPVRQAGRIPRRVALVLGSGPEITGEIKTQLRARLRLASLVMFLGFAAFVVRDQATINGRTGDTVSLIPLGGEARRVTTHGLAYPLIDGTLPFGPALGVSNEMTASRAQVQVREGLLLCVHLSLQETKTRDGDRSKSKEA